MTESAQIIDARRGLTGLFSALMELGYTLIGPTLRDQAIVYDELNGVDDLPAGWMDEQDGGHYR
ncbi:MAG TPA: sulfite reductase subunit A, partial [Gammaproteobacteria bacterium]|nr:sulfite reductase subunit A [Gammaproteobacteria bacterium]